MSMGRLLLGWRVRSRDDALAFGGDGVATG